jgi:pimeloyl-ACP methyl ester carboxylesterase
MISKYYANLANNKQTHYRRSGAGKPVVLLHASPMSSALMVPMITALEHFADVIAPDTPGYGQSDTLDPKQLSDADDLSPYVSWLLEFIESLGLEKIALYGTATGAQIAIEFARTHPDKLEFVILDSSVHFSELEKQEIVSGYFPDVSPQQDGSHLQTIWNMSRGVFQWFPWYAQNEEHRVATNEPTAEAVHAMALAYLQAGSDYSQAYRRAFNNEDATRVADITIPVRVIRWAGGMLKAYSDRYDDFSWPDNVQMCHCGSAIEQRYQAIADVIIEFND